MKNKLLSKSSEELANLSLRQAYEIGYEAGKQYRIEDAFSRMAQAFKKIGQSASSVEGSTIEHEGKMLRKVNRIADIGDYIRVIGQTKYGLLTENIFHGPVEKDIEGNLVVGDLPFHVYERTVNRTCLTVEVFKVDFSAEQRTVNQQRAELIAKAKEFVEKYQAVRLKDKSHDIGNITAREHYYETEFFTKGKKVTAVIYRLLFGETRGSYTSHVGRANCAPGDVFNEWIGKAIALAKALQIDIPVEFLDAVQPTVAKGQIVEALKYSTGESTGFIGKVTGLNFNGHPEFTGHFASHYKVIDDTNAEYEVS